MSDTTKQGVRDLNKIGPRPKKPKKRQIPPVQDFHPASPWRCRRENCPACGGSGGLL